MPELNLSASDRPRTAGSSCWSNQGASSLKEAEPLCGQETEYACQGLWLLGGRFVETLKEAMVATDCYLLFSLYLLTYLIYLMFFSSVLSSRKCEFRIIQRERRNFGKYEKFKRFDNVGIVLDQSFVIFVYNTLFIFFKYYVDFWKKFFFWI